MGVEDCATGADASVVHQYIHTAKQLQGHLCARRESRPISQVQLQQLGRVPQGGRRLQGERGRGVSGSDSTHTHLLDVVVVQLKLDSLQLL